MLGFSLSRMDQALDTRVNPKIWLYFTMQHPLELSGHIFFRIFFPASKKVIFFLVAEHLKNYFFCGFPKRVSGFDPFGRNGRFNGVTDQSNHDIPTTDGLFWTDS